MREILLLHHTHTDIGYTHDQPIVWELNRQFIDDMLDEIDRTQDWDANSRPIWTCEVTETLRHWLRTAAPPDIDRFKRAVGAGRLSGCAMPYNFTPMVGVPEFIRALAALSELRRTVGLKFNVALNHDINGLPWSMIPLLLDADVEMVIMGINVHFGAFPLHPPLFFKWIGPDGRGLIALNGAHCGMARMSGAVTHGHGLARVFIWLCRCRHRMSCVCGLAVVVRRHVFRRSLARADVAAVFQRVLQVRQRHLAFIVVNRSRVVEDVGDDMLHAGEFQ